MHSVIGLENLQTVLNVRAIALKCVYGLSVASKATSSLYTLILPRLLVSLLGRKNSLSMVELHGNLRITYDPYEAGQKFTILLLRYLFLRVDS